VVPLDKCKCLLAGLVPTPIVSGAKGVTLVHQVIFQMAQVAVAAILSLASYQPVAKGDEHLAKGPL
jgi:hypothetical protein